MTLSFVEAPTARVLSLGGGVDSFAMLVDAIARGARPDAVAFVDVTDPEGADPGEWPATYRHIRDVVAPLCRRHRIRFAWIDSGRYPVRDARSLFAWLWARGQIPVAGPNRICTRIAKVERFERWLDDHFPDQLVEVWIGFEAGEEGRSKYDPNAGRPRKHRPGLARRCNRFPLIERRLCRCRCVALIERAGHPVPTASACTFCPYGSKGEWQVLAAELPETFARAVELEARKAPTEAGRKLSIMGFRSFEKRPAPERTRLKLLRDHAGVAYAAPTLPEFIQGDYRPKAAPCEVCGAPEKVRKVAGCADSFSRAA